MTTDKCAVCSATGPLKLDQFYKRMLCITDWDKRKKDAIANHHSEWLEANGLLRELAALETGDTDVSHINVEATGEEEIPGR